MGGLLGMHERSVVLANPAVAITTSAASQSAQLLADPSKNGPAKFIIMCSTAFHFKQGGSTVTASSASTRVPADFGWEITVESTDHNYIAVIWDTEEGLFQATRIDKTK